MLSRDDVRKILSYWPEHKWELQGFGMLRTYLDGPNEPRLQVWDQRLAEPGNSTVHDHPWDFISTIYAGVLFNQRYERKLPGVYPSDRNAHKAEIWQERFITPGSEGGVQGKTFDTWLQPMPVEVYGASEQYGQTWKELHLTRYLPGTVTMIERTRTREEDLASSLSKGQIPWTFFHPRPATHDECEAIISSCLERWWL